MKRPPVILDRDQRVAACIGMATSLLFHEVELVDLSVGAKHFHLLARFTPLGQRPAAQIPGCPDGVGDSPCELLKRAARHYVGIAKKTSARALSNAGVIAPGGVWAIRGKIKPIFDRAHQVRVARYIRNHAEAGATVWSTIRNGQQQ